MGRPCFGTYPSAETKYPLTLKSSSAIHTLNQQCLINPKNALAYFYFDFNDNKKSTLSHLLRSFVAQLATQSRDAMPMVQKGFTEHSNGRLQADLNVLARLLLEVIGLYQDVFLVIDALDECQERDDLLDWLGDFTISDPLNAHLLLCSRNEKDIGDVLIPLVDCQIVVEDANVDPDIRLYIQDRLSRDRKLQKWPAEVKEEIERSLMEKVNGMSVTRRHAAGEVTNSCVQVPIGRLSAGYALQMQQPCCAQKGAPIASENFGRNIQPNSVRH